YRRINYRKGVLKMNVCIEQVDHQEQECVRIECVEVTKKVTSIVTFVKSISDIVIGYMNGREYTLYLRDIIYFEAIDENVFAYTNNKIYEIESRLYELEKQYYDQLFTRCSKSYIINLLALESVSPALNGRFIAHMNNHQKLIISRQYVKALKDRLTGGKS